MKRLMRLVLVTLPCVALTAKAQSFAPNPHFKPKVGDLCRVGHFDPTRQTWNDVVAAKDEASWIKHANAIGDNETLAALDAEGSTTKVRAGTRVKFVSHKDLVTSKTPRTAARVRLDEGPNKDRLVWVERQFLFHPANVSPIVRGIGDPRAATLLKSGLNLEKLGKKAEALGFYREIVIHHDDSEEAKTATERIKALGEKVPAPIKSPAKPLFRLLISESSGEETTSLKNAGSEPKPDPRVQQYP